MRGVMSEPNIVHFTDSSGFPSGDSSGAGGFSASNSASPCSSFPAACLFPPRRSSHANRIVADIGTNIPISRPSRNKLIISPRGFYQGTPHLPKFLIKFLDFVLDLQVGFVAPFQQEHDEEQYMKQHRAKEPVAHEFGHEIRLVHHQCCHGGK